MFTTANRSGAEDAETLKRLCLDFICHNLDSICVKSRIEDVEALSNIEDMDDEDLDLNAALDQLHKRQEAKIEVKSATYERLNFAGFQDDHDQVLSQELSEELLARLADMDKVDDFVLSLFDGSKARLKRVRIQNASNVSARGLQALVNHNLTELEVGNLVKATIGDLVQNLNSWSQANMQILNVSNSTFIDHFKHSNFLILSKLPALTSLNVSGTEFNKQSLEIIMTELGQLEQLDMSKTKVTDISSLVKAKDRLKSLSMAELGLSERASEVLVQLDQLRHLDISDNHDERLLESLILNSSKFKVAHVLCHYDSLPNLVSLDISGCTLRQVELLANFLQHHPRLYFVGLMLTNICNEAMFNDDKYVVTGTANERQILEALRRYIHRPSYIQKALYHLFSLTQSYTTPREDVIRLVLRAAKQYPSVFSVQMAVTACLYNLSHGDLSKELHPHVLRDIVNADLDAMETFQQHQQLQKNILLTICCDRIINDVNFDRFRCAKLALNCLSAWQDNSMNKMSVAICSMLAARITTAQTSELGSDAAYMQKLLQIVRGKKEDRVIDVTLKYTLSALWNLTDESPLTCKVFLAQGGMDLFVEVLDAFPGDKCIETKVLGLLNNIAEVAHLRGNLLVDNFISNLRSLMYSKEIEVSYFAAGISAHLSSDYQLDWSKIVSIKKDKFMEELGNVVLGWKTPVQEMVAYRSFRPFYPLMAENQPFPVQMWAVWALHHVCCNKGDRYCPMLAAQGGDEILYKLLQLPFGHAQMKKLIHEIFDTMRSNGYKKF